MKSQRRGHLKEGFTNRMKKKSDKIENQDGFTDKLKDKTSHIASYGMNRAVNYVLPDLNTASNAELQEELKRKASKVNDIVTAAAQDPEVQQLIQTSGEAFAKLTQEILDAVDEPVKEIAATGVDTASQIILTSGKTLGKTGVDLVMSVLGEVPVVGGVVDLLVTAGVAFNGIAKNIKIGSENLFKIISIGNELVGDVLEPVQEGVNEFSELGDKAKQTYASIEERLGLLQGTYKEQQGATSNMDTRLQQPNEELYSEEAKERLDQPPEPKFISTDNRLTQEPQAQAVPQAEPVQAQPVQAQAVPQAKQLKKVTPKQIAPPPPPPPLPPRPMRQINTASQIKPTVLQEQAKQLKKVTPVRRASPTPVRRASPTPVRRASPTPVRRAPPTPVRRAPPTPVRRAPVNRTQKKQNKKKGKSRRKPRKR